MALNRITNNGNNYSDNANIKWISLMTKSPVTALAARLLIYDRGTSSNNETRAFIGELELYNGSTKVSGNGSTPTVVATATSSLSGYGPANAINGSVTTANPDSWISGNGGVAFSPSSYEGIMLKFSSTTMMDKVRFFSVDGAVNPSRGQVRDFEIQFTRDPSALVDDPKNSSKWFGVDLLNGNANGSERAYDAETGGNPCSLQPGFAPEPYKLLLQDRHTGTFYRWDGTNLLPVGPGPLDSNMFALFGSSNLNGLTQVSIDTAGLVTSDLRVCCWSPDLISPPTLLISGVPNPHLVIPTGLIDLSNIARLNRVILTATESGGGRLRYIVSRDLNTWYTIPASGQAWMPISPNPATVGANGISRSTLNNLTVSDWEAFFGGSPDAIAFGYYLEMSSFADTAANDSLALDVVYDGEWEQMCAGVDFRASYYDDGAKLKVKLLRSGDWKVNVP